MPGGMVDASEYARVRRMARAAGREIDKAFKDSLKDAAEVGVEAVRTKLGQVSLHAENRGRHGAGRRRSRGLRQQLKANTKVQVRTKDVRIVQGASGIQGANAKGLPRRLNQDGPFSHPVYGRGSVSQRSWRHFDSVIVTKQAEMTQKVEAALSAMVDRLGEG